MDDVHFFFLRLLSRTSERI